MVVLRHRLMPPSPSAILQKHTCLIYMRKTPKEDETYHLYLIL